jgi:hypothetical protein
MLFKFVSTHWKLRQHWSREYIHLSALLNIKRAANTSALATANAPVHNTKVRKYVAVGVKEDESQLAIYDGLRTHQGTHTHAHDTTRLTIAY